MTQFQFRVCRFTPDLQQPDEVYEFAILCASEKSCALLGVDLSAYHLVDKNPVGANVIANSFDVVWNRIDSTIRTKKPHSGFELIKYVSTNAPTNLWLSDIEDVSAIHDNCRDVAYDIFEDRIAQKVEEVERKYKEKNRTDSDPPVWHEKPKTSSREAVFA